MFDQTDDLLAKRDDQMLGESRDNLFERLVIRAEADLKVAQALAARESQRADQIKRLETTLIGHINRLQQQILESREAEIKDLRSEIFVCAERITQFEGSHSTAAVRKEMAQELGDFRLRLTERQVELENHHSGLARLGESLNAHLSALEDELHDKLDGIRTAQAEIGHFKLATQSLWERVAHAESSSWRGRALALHNVQQLEQTSKSLRSEMSALNALIIELNEKQAERRSPDPSLQEMTRNFAAKIEEFEHCLQQEQRIQMVRDSRLGELDRGLGLLAERVTKTESLAHESHAAAAAEFNSAAEFRQAIGQELAALEAKLNDLSNPMAVDKLVEWGARAEEWQRQAEQKFMLLDSRDLEQERNARELAANLAAKHLEQEARTDEKLQALTSNHEELACLRAEIESLAARIAVGESAAQRVETRTDSAAMQTEHLEDRLKRALGALSSEVAQLAEHQQALSLAQVERRENQTKFATDLLEIQRQMAREQGAFEHWGKGLREALGAELSSTGAQLSDRQSALEQGYARLERSQETFKANLDALADQLKEKPAPEPQDHELWDKIHSQLGALGERMSELEARVRKADDRVNLISRDSEHHIAALRGDLSALAASFDQRPLPPYQSIIDNVADKLGARLQELENQFTSRFSLYEKREGERDQQAEQIIATFKSEITALGDKLRQQPSAIVPDDAALGSLAERLTAKIEELRRQTAEQFNALASRAGEAQALPQRSEPSLERLAHLSTAPESSDKIAIFSGQPGTKAADLSAHPAAAAKGAGDSAAEVHRRSEQEQLIKLEERMSSEIARVRAQLKERSGRWKVRQSASLKRSERFTLDPEL